MRLGPHTVTVLRAAPATEDGYGNPVDGTPVESTLDDCSVQPVEGDEQTIGRDTVVSRMRLIAPVGDLQATDRVRYAGDVYDVDGEVQLWDFAPSPHMTALLRRSRNT